MTSAVVGAGMVALGTAAAMPGKANDAAALSDVDPSFDPSSSDSSALDDRERHAARGSRSGRSATLPDGRTQAPKNIWVLPVKSYDVSSHYGPRWGTNHNGVDLAADIGTPVYAAHDGVVTRANYYGGYGLIVEIDHGGGLTTRYGHNSAVTVNVGEYVEAGDLIARVGNTGYSTGAHLHFEMRLNDQAFDPIPFMRKHDVDILRHRDSPYLRKA